MLPVLSFGQILGRYDVSQVVDINDTTWELSGTFIDVTGSYTALQAAENDRIVMRGINTSGQVVFDRFRVDSIIASTATELTVYIVSDLDGGILNNSVRPLSGSFPICRVLENTRVLVKPSWYQQQFDPDYDAAIDNLNTEENKVYPPYSYEIPTDSQNAVTIPFRLTANTKIFFNGAFLPPGLWSGVGSYILNINLSTKLYDKLLIFN